MLRIILTLCAIMPGAWGQTYIPKTNKGPVTAMGDMMDFVAGSVADITFVAGMIMCLAGFYQYLKHRESPQEVSISQVLILFILGASLMLMKYIPRGL